MASQYGILTVANLSEIVGSDLTALTNHDGSTRVYSDAIIERQISMAERLVFGHMHKTYTSSNIPDEVQWAVEQMARIYMVNLLVRDGYASEGQGHTDEIIYFKNHIFPLVEDKKMAANLIDFYPVEDYFQDYLNY